MSIESMNLLLGIKMFPILQCSGNSYLRHPVDIYYWITATFHFFRTCFLCFSAVNMRDYIWLVLCFALTVALIMFTMSTIPPIGRFVWRPGLIYWMSYKFSRNPTHKIAGERAEFKRKVLFRNYVLYPADTRDK